MHALKMLHQNLQKSCPQIHNTRLTALLDGVEALVYGQSLTVTKLGRHLPRDISMKHGIKHSDRLIGNPHLYEERLAIYQSIANWLISDQRQIIILIDWSDYTYDRSHLILRASVPVGGRALTLYEEVHPGHCYGNHKIEKAFLNTLHDIIPNTCIPIVVTDAGFIGPWFKSVLKLGWHFIGRLPKSLLYRETSREDWLKCKDLFGQTTRKPCYVGEVQLVRSNPFLCHLYHYRYPNKGRHKMTMQGERARSKHSQKNAQREATPWILASSLPPDDATAKQVIQFYRTRMQIEEAFRDIKNQRTGFSLSETRSRSKERLSNLLLIGMLATWVVWLMGRLAEEKKLHYQYQANTVRHYRVLSLFYLGCLIVIQGVYHFTKQEYLQAIKLIQQDMLRQWEA